MATPRLLQRATWRAPAPKVRRQEANPFDSPRAPTTTTPPTRAGARTSTANPFDSPKPTTPAPRTSSSTRTSAAPNPFDKPGGAKAPAGESRFTVDETKRVRDDPIQRVQTNVSKVLAFYPSVSPGTQKKIDRMLKDVGQGVPEYEQQRYAEERTRRLSHLPGSMRSEAERILQAVPTGSGLQRPPMSAMRDRGREALEAAGFNPNMARRAADLYYPDRAHGDFITTPTGAAMRFLGKGQQAVASTIGEFTRQAEANKPTFKLGPIEVQLSPKSWSEVGQAGREGWNLQRHDSASSILSEAEKIRESQGESTGPVLGGFNAVTRNVPGAGIVADMTFGAATDPLTYLTFGTSSLAKGALKTVRNVTDADTAARVAREGIDVLTDAQKASVRAAMGIDDAAEAGSAAARRGREGWQALERGAQGGLGVRPIMGPQTGRTILPGYIPRGGARAVGQAVRQVPYVGNALEKAGQLLKSTFIPRARAARNAAIGGQDFADQMYEGLTRAKGFQHAGTDRAVTRLTNAMAKVDVTPQEMAEIVGPQLDIGATGIVNTGDALRDAELQTVVDRFSDVRRELTQMQIDRGRLLADVDLPAAQANDLAARQAERASYMTDQLERITDPEGRRRLRDWDIENPVEERRFIPEAEYMTHVRTPEGDALWNSGVLRDSKFGKMLHSDPYLQAREIREMSARQINESLSAELGYPIKYFHEDPLVAFAARARSAYGTVASEELVNSLRTMRAPDGTSLVDEWDQLDDIAPTGQVTGVIAPGHKAQRPGYAELRLLDPATGGVHHLSVPAEMKELVENTWNTMHNPTEIGDAFDKMMTWWKTMATVPLPFGLGFHLRNAESNVMLNWMSGIGVESADYFKAQRLQKAMKLGVKDTGDWQQYLTAADRTRIQDALERETLTTGVLGAIEDLPADTKLGAGYTLGSKTPGAQVGHVLRRANPVSAKSIWATSGRTLAQGVEQNARLAHFLAAERKFGNADAAAASVRRWLFDYSDLTKAEQQFKRYLPFYTWARKSTAVVIETALRDPRKLAQFERLRQQLIEGGGADLSETIVPDYLRESPTGIPFRAPSLGPVQGAANALGYPDPGTITYADPDTPFNTPFELGNAAYGLLAAAPVLNRVLPRYGTKTAAENLRPFFSMLGGPTGVARAGYEALMGQKTYSGAPIRDEYGAVPAPLNLPILKQLFAPSGQMTPAGRNLAESIWPAIPKIEGIVGHDPRSEDKRIRRILSIVTGIPFAPVDIATQEAESYRRNEILNKFNRDLQAQGELGAG